MAKRVEVRESGRARVESVRRDQRRAERRGTILVVATCGVGEP